MERTACDNAEIKKCDVSSKVNKRTIRIPNCSDKLKAILLNVCEELDVDPLDVIGKERNWRLVQAREEFIWRCRHETDASFPRIAKAIGRDHSTAVYHFYYRKAKVASEKNSERWVRKEPKYNVREDSGALNERQERVRLLMLRGYNQYDIAVDLGVSITVIKQDRRAIKIYRPLPTWVERK